MAEVKYIKYKRVLRNSEISSLKGILLHNYFRYSATCSTCILPKNKIMESNITSVDTVKSKN